MPESKISFSSRKLDDCICVKSCISSEKYKELCLSNHNLKRYQVFIIDSDHRKTITRVAVLTILTVGSGAVFFLIEMLLMLLLVLTIVVLLFAIFCKSEKKVMVLDVNGKLLGWLVTRD